MYSEEDWGIVDQSAVAMRVATIAAGIWLSYAVCGASAVYVALTWQRPHRVLIALLFGAGILSAAVISRLPRERIVRSRRREAFFLAWSLGDLSLMILATLADGGTGSPIALFLFIPVVFSAMSYPLRSVLTVGGLSVAGFLAVAVVVGGAGWGYQALFTVMLMCTGAMSAWQARNHDRQRAALIAVSRRSADGLPEQARLRRSSGRGARRGCARRRRRRRAGARPRPLQGGQRPARTRRRR